MKKVRIIEKKLVFDHFFKIEEALLQYEKFDGTMSPQIKRLNFERGDSVAAIVYNRDTSKVTLTRQFRFPTFEKGPGWLIEAVAGMKEKSESAEKAMQREILEELGYLTEEMKIISTFYLSPGGSSERIILYYVEVNDDQKVQQGGGLVDEDIQIIEMSSKELERALESNLIQDAKTLIGIQYFLHNTK